MSETRYEWGGKRAGRRGGRILSVLVGIVGLIGLLAAGRPLGATTSAAMQSPAEDAPGVQEFAGKWVLKYSGQNFLALTLQFADEQLTGTMILPKHFQMDQGGEFSKISSDLATMTIAQASIVDGHLQFVAKRDSDEEQFSMSFVDPGHALLEMVGFPLQPWKIERAKASENLTVATNWPEPGPKNVSPEIAALQAKLKEMVEEDQAVRLATPISIPKMEQVDAQHYPELLTIFEKYGWLRRSVVGREASDDYWLLAQHQDAHLDFQKRILPELERAAGEGESSRVNYAYFYDRVMTNAGKPQHWGTQASCQDGKPAMRAVDDPAGLAERRKEFEMMPEEEYLKQLVPMCAAQATARDKPPEH